MIRFLGHRQKGDAGAISGRRAPAGIALLAVGLLTFGFLLNTPAGLLGKADAVGYAVCHRIDLRSFDLGVRQLPLCARCTGMYLGAVLGLVYQAVLGRGRGGMPSKRISAVLGVLVVAFALDGTNSFLQLISGAPALYIPRNELRLLTGSGMGLVIAAVLFPAFNQTVWRTWDRRPALAGMRGPGGLLVLTLILDWMVLSGNPLVLYPLALVSAAGVLLVLTLAYTTVVVITLRAENRFDRWGGLTLPLLCGFGLGVLQVVALDLARFWLTGTWSGFHLG